MGLGFLMACQETKPVESKEKVESETNQPIDTIEEVEEPKLFDMHPEPIYEEESSAFEKPNLHYFSGQKGSDNISFVLLKGGEYSLDGYYLNQTQNEMVHVSAKKYAEGDSLKISLQEQSMGHFEGAWLINENKINGIWVGTDSTEIEFEVTEEINSPEQIQVFTDLSTGVGLILTKNGIRKRENPDGEVDFNTFMNHQTVILGGYDTGEEWINYSQQIFWDRDQIVYTWVEINNVLWTDFEGTDGELGTEQESYVKMEVKVITDGLTHSDTISFTEDMNLSVVLFQENICFVDDDGKLKKQFKWQASEQTFKEK